MERALGEWIPTNISDPGQSDLTDASNSNYAHRLVRFLGWAAGKVDLSKATYQENIIEGYQAQLVTGKWSGNRRTSAGAAEGTTNCYVDIACDYLKWLHSKGQRPPFEIPTKIKSIPYHRNSIDSFDGRREIEVREGRLEGKKQRLRMPLDKEIKTWLDSIESRFGYIVRLMCETVLHTALRRAEVAAFRVDTLPLNRANWFIGNPASPKEDQLVRFGIQYGAKGRGRQYDHGDTHRPEKDIKMPLYLAERIDDYRQTIRARQISDWVREVRGANNQLARQREAVHLFRHPKTNAPITATQFYEFWKGGILPYPEWSPHKGRHWWPCAILWRKVKFAEKMSTQEKLENMARLERSILETIQFYIKPQLRHRDIETCMIYVEWVQDMLDFSLPDLFTERLDQLLAE